MVSFPLKEAAGLAEKRQGCVVSHMMLLARHVFAILFCRHSSFSAGATPTGSPRRRSREAFVDYTVADLSSPASSPRMGRATHTGAAAAASPSLLAGNAVAPLSAATLRKTDRLKLASREDMLEDDDDMFEL